MTPLKWRKLSVPKRGHRAEEYEDAAAGDGASGRFAVADGATESAFAGDWSRLLAEAFVRDSVLTRGWPDWLPDVRKRWLEAVGARELPWYLEEKFAQGAFATLLGLEIHHIAEAGAWEWKAVAVGDCCLFHVRGQKLRSSFPLENSADFNTSPALLGSRPGEAPSNQRARGKAKPGDSFVLASDALAQWLLKCHESQRSIWPDLLNLMWNSDEAGFARFIDALWEAKELKVDDVTLLAIELPAEVRP